MIVRCTSPVLRWTRVRSKRKICCAPGQSRSPGRSAQGETTLLAASTPPVTLLGLTDRCDEVRGRGHHAPDRLLQVRLVVFGQQDIVSPALHDRASNRALGQ